MDTLKKALGSPITIVVGDSSYKAKTLSISQLFTLLEKIVIAKHISNAKQITEGMSGKERNAFMLDVWKEIPKITNVSEQISEIMSDFNAIISVLAYSISKAEGIDEAKILAELNEHVTNDNVQDYVSIVMSIMGVDQNEDVNVEDAANKDTSKKN